MSRIVLTLECIQPNFQRDTDCLKTGPSLRLNLPRGAGVSPESCVITSGAGCCRAPSGPLRAIVSIRRNARRVPAHSRGASIGFTVNELGAILADRDDGGAPVRVRGWRRQARRRGTPVALSAPLAARIASRARRLGPPPWRYSRGKAGRTARGICSLRKSREYGAKLSPAQSEFRSQVLGRNAMRKVTFALAALVVDFRRWPGLFRPQQDSGKMDKGRRGKDCP